MPEKNEGSSVVRSWQNIEGWFDYPDVYAYELERVPDAGIIVEVGTWMGRSTAFMGELVRDADRGIQFWAVDHGFGNADKAADACAGGMTATGGNIAGRLVTNLRDAGVLDWVLPLITTSLRAARTFADGSLDFVYIDGNHTRESVLEDCRAWWPKIKPGGTLAGHDYDVHFPEVVAAVTEFFGRSVPHPIRPTCWGVTKSLVYECET